MIIIWLTTTLRTAVQDAYLANYVSLRCAEKYKLGLAVGTVSVTVYDSATVLYRFNWDLDYLLDIYQQHMAAMDELGLPPESGITLRKEQLLRF